VSEQPEQTPVVSVDRRAQQFVDQLRAAGYAVDDTEDDPLCGRESGL
jgi:hypothetical protein